MRPAFAVMFAVTIAAASWVVVSARQQTPLPLPRGLEFTPQGVRGEAVWPAFEGWGPLRDGTNVLLLGYYNRNKEQELDIPIGPNNNIEPGGPDYGQPTHFHVGRQWGVFAIQLPKEFSTKRLTWTLIANGQKAAVTFWMNPAYWINFFTHAASGNTPPVVRFSLNGQELTGPPPGIAQELSGVVGQPVTLTLWASDKPPTYKAPEPPDGGRDQGRGTDRAANFDVSAALGRSGAGGRGRESGPPADVTVIWKKYRGSGEVRIADERTRLFSKGDVNAVMEATTTATFSAPGEYWLRAQVNDASGDGGGGDQCCWTTAHVKVLVK